MFQRYMRCVVTLVGPALVISCGTYLKVAQQQASDPKPDGIVVNERAAYDIEVTPENAFGQVAKVTSTGKPVVGVDPVNVIDIDICRMPFASGKLALTLTKEQVVKEISLTSETGGARAADAAAAAVNAKATISVPATPTPTPE